MQTTQDLIKILPFKKEFKDDFLARYDSLTPDQKFAAERIIWDFYDALYEARLAENMQKAMDRAKKNEEKLDHTFYERVRKLTDSQLQEEYSETETTEELTDAREELENILKQTS